MPRNPNVPPMHGCGPAHTHTSASENIKLQMMMAKLEDSLKNEFILKEQLKTINFESLLGSGNIEINCISKIEKTESNGLKDTYTIYFNNGETFSFEVTNGKDGEVGPEGKQGNDGLGIKETKLVDGNLVITYTDDTSVTLGRVTGADGTNGENGTNGADGQDGISISDATIDAAGNLILALSNNTFITAGKVVGNDGANGSDGKSAFDLAKENGYAGTLTEWLESLKGEKGNDGTGISLKATQEDCQIVGDAYIINDPENIDYGHIYILTNLDPRTFEDGGEIKGPKGNDGVDGREIELQVTEQAIQWRYKNASTWADLIALELLKGKDGVDGKDGTNGKDGLDGQNGSDGKDGIDGINGEDGKDGREIKLQVTDTAVQWCYDEQSPTWINLINLDELKGANGINGVDGRPVELQIANGYIQWRISGDTTWQNLVSTDSLKLTYDSLTEAQKAELKGEQGPRGYGIKGVRHYEQVGLRHTYELYFEDPNIDSIEGCTFDVYDGAAGKDGKDGAPGPGIKEVQYSGADTEFVYYQVIFENSAIAPSSLRIPKGVDGYTPVKGVDYFDGQNGKDGENGKDGISPVLRIINDIWEISHDNGLTFTSTGIKAVGPAGADGAPGLNGVGIANIQHDRNDPNGNCIYVITLTDGRTEEFTAYKGEQGPAGEDGLTTAIKINGVIYAHENGTIELPTFLTEDNLTEYATKTYVTDEIVKAVTDGKVDLTGYATETYVDTKVADLVDSAPETLNTLNELAVAINSNKEVVDALDEAITNKADKEHTHEEYLTEHQSLENYYTKPEVEAKIPSLEGYAKTEDIPTDYLKESDLEGYSKFSGSYTDLTDKPEIPEAYNDTPIRELISEKADKTELNGLATQEWVQGELAKIDPTIPSEYITETELEAKGYITAAALNGYAKTADIPTDYLVANDIKDKADKSDLTTLATKQELQEAIAAIDFPETDLGNYYTKTEVENKITKLASDVDARVGELDDQFSSIYATKTELTTHINNQQNPHNITAEQLDVYTKAETREYVNTNIADAVSGLAKKSDIPSVEGLASQTWVESKGYLTSHQDISGKADKTDLNNYYTKEDTHTKFLSVDIAATKEYVDEAISLSQIPFPEDKYVTNPLGSFKVGESVKDLTVAEIFAKLLGLSDKVVEPDEPEIPDEPQGIIETIMANETPMYAVTQTGSLEPIDYQLLTFNSETAKEKATTNGFYQIVNGDEVIESGYQQLAAVYLDMPYMIALPKAIDFDTHITIQSWNDLESYWETKNIKLISDTQVFADMFGQTQYELFPNVDPEVYTIWFNPDDGSTGALYRFIITE